MAGEPLDISVIICTFNREDLLGKCIESALAQDCGEIRYEIIIVDNHSTDGTRQICESYCAQYPSQVRYIFELKQGVSYARNTGIAAAKAPILAFTDDDVCVSRDWIFKLKCAFDEHPEVVGVGGKVLPAQTTDFPGWLTREHWSPLALQDYGDLPLRVNADNCLCLVTANFALRREVFERVDMFSPTFQRVKDHIGSVEDHELHLRLWAANFQEIYVPDILVFTEVQAERLTKAYHRRWHKGNGQFIALLPDKEVDHSAARLFDVPAYLYKQTLLDVIKWCKCMLMIKPGDAFFYETRIWFFQGFFRSRRESFHKSSHPGTLREMTSFLFSMLRLYMVGKVRAEKR